MRSATYRAVVGIFAASASTTALRPTTYSGAPSRERPELRPDGARRPPLSERSERLAAARFFFAAGCLSRSVAFGVGPRPFSCLRRWPPVPTVGPFLSLRIAPLRWLL